MPERTGMEDISKGGVVVIKPEDLRSMLREAAAGGAKDALANIGLSDEKAIHDFHEIRTLLDSFRTVKKSMLSALGSMLVKGLVVGVGILTAFKMGLLEWKG